MLNIKTSIYIANVKPLSDDDLFDIAYNVVTNDRKNKVDNFHFKKDKVLSLASELLLLYSLRNIGYDTDNIEFIYEKNGKPYLKNSNDIYYNISHSGEYVMCAVSSREVGCDIEIISDINLNIANRFFSDEEFNLINSKSNLNEKKDIFFKLWTLKESFIKNTGLGMTLPLKSFAVNPENNITVRQDINENNYFFKLYDIEGYMCAVCSLINDLPLNLINVDLQNIF